MPGKIAHHILFFWSFVLSLVLFSPDIYSQNEIVKFDRISTIQGLSESTVMCIMQDSMGFMWFGTYDGLNMYDGYNFTVFKKNLKDTNSLSNNLIRTIFEEKQGVFWIGTDFGLNKYVRSTSTFTRYFVPETSIFNSVESNRINAIFVDSEGIFWVGSANGLFKFDTISGYFSRYPEIAAGDTSKPGLRYIYSIFEDKNGKLWAGTDGEGLVRIDKQTGGYKTWKNIPEENTSIADNDVFCFYEISDTSMLLGTFGGGLNVFNKQSGEFYSYLNNINNPKSTSENNILACCEKDGYLWLGTYENGINTFELKKAGKTCKNIPSFTRYTHDKNNLNSLSSNAIRSMYEDRGGVLWIGTLGGGISKYDRKKTKFKHYKSNLSPETYGISEDKDGILWIGTSEGLESFNPKTSKFRQYFLNNAITNNSISNNIRKIYHDRSGTLWIGTRNSGLFKFDKKNGAFVNYSSKDDDSTSLSYNYVTDICEDSEGSFWIGTDEGLNKMDRNTGRFIHYTQNKYNINNSVRCVYEDNSKTLWIGTRSGLFKYDKANNNFKSYQSNLNDTNSLSNNYVLTIYEDVSGRLWIGTLDGLNLFNRKTETFNQYHENDGLPNESIFGILEDKNKNLWLSTTKGISKFNPEHNTFRNYTTVDGLQSDQFNKAAFKNSEGKMFFGGHNGYNAFYPDSIVDSEYQPNIFIVDFRIFNKSFGVGDKKENRSILDKNIVVTKEIVLSYKEYMFSFEFAALDFSDPENIKYAYKMENFESDWNYIGADRRFATYTNLPPGEYIFKVIATNSDGIWTHDETSIKIIVTPPYWKTWWFRIGIFISFVIILFLVYKLRIKNLKKQKETLEQQVKERTLKLEQSYNNVKNLSETGNKITACLSVETIINVVYENVNQLMDASIFGIGVFNNEKQRIDFFGTKEKGITLPFYSYDITDETRLAQWCLKNQKEVLINDFQKEYKNYLPAFSKPKAGEIPESVIYIPLSLKEIPIGVITVQSFNKSAYNAYHADILRNIGAYTSIALDNAKAYHQIEKQAKNLEIKNKQLKESHEEELQLNEELLQKNELLHKQSEQLEQALQRLKKTQSQLIQAEKMASVGILTSGIAHEINNPLNFIQGGVAAIENYISENIQGHVNNLMPFLNYINEGVSRASAIVDSLNRLGSKSELQKQKCDINLIIDNCLLALSNYLNERIQVEKNYVDVKYELIGDESELLQVFLNVITNAFQAIPEKGIIKIITQIEDDVLNTFISDNGVGISEEHIKKVADPFFTTKVPGIGTGLGMSIAYSIVQKHGGSIKYKSKPGNGTIVKISLPVKKI